MNDKEIIEKKVDKYMKETEGNVAYREIAALPQFELKLLSKDKIVEEKTVIAAVEDTVTTTYKMYAVTTDGEQKAIVASEEDAQNIINNIKEGVNEAVDLKLGIAEVYTKDNTATSNEDAINALNEVKVVKVAAYEEEQKAKAEQAKKEAYAKKMKSLATTTTAAASGSISGMPLSIPVNGSISSRFGSRSASRSTIHTGLDIASPLGTGIRAISSGTVTYAGYKGSYGNLIIINHGNGVESYYAHCSAIYVSAGQGVDSSTTIGAVGSTGNSTGPHLHLEIRVGGTPVNPQNYLY